jgi:hypothetical protein
VGEPLPKRFFQAFQLFTLRLTFTPEVFRAILAAEIIPLPTDILGNSGSRSHIYLTHGVLDHDILPWSRLFRLGLYPRAGRTPDHIKQNNQQNEDNDDFVHLAYSFGFFFKKPS